jgi:3'-phosphoadenosine 5'-phosphosulfate sulfotransferase (PAPS reductase)/FAD synthetase
MTDPFKVTEPTVISFSGGRTSAYMLWRILQSNGGLPDEAKVVFANTGKEEEATLKFVKDCQDNWNVPITWLEFRKDKPLYEEVSFETASRNGEPFEQLIEKRKYLPNPVSRFCTVELKVRTMHRYLKANGWKEWVSMLGIRADEPRRLAKIGNQDYGKHEEKCAPLGRAGITAEDVGKFWAENTFDLGLPNFNGKTFHGNCDLCFLKGYPQTLSLIQEKPERAVWWAKMEAQTRSTGEFKGDGARFRKDRPSYADMMNFAKTQGDMFGSSEESIACFCGD